MKQFIRDIAKHPILIGDFNWDIYTDGNFDKCYSIAKDSSQCEDSCFGDKHHIMRLLEQDHLSWDKFTDQGRQFMSGAYCRMIRPENNKPFVITSFI